MRKWLLIAFSLLVLLPAIGFGAWAWLSMTFPYSEGERTGFVQKISNMGWVFKSWEGELTMPTQAGVPPQTFTFSVRDNGVAEHLLKLSGERVTLRYEQHRFVPTTCFGETEYFIKAVRESPEKK